MVAPISAITRDARPLKTYVRRRVEHAPAINVIDRFASADKYFSLGLDDPQSIGHNSGLHDAGWSSPVAREAHNLEVTGSNPVPATFFAVRRKKREEMVESRE